MTGPGTTRSGPGRIVVAVYALLAVAATSRSAVQLGTRADEAPLAYGLSAAAAAVYLVATAGLAAGGRTARRIAWVACTVELVGVVAVGAASLAFPDAFPRATVWSRFGQGYLFVPLVLPVVGLWWLRRTGAGSGPA
jgi:hypothetical protein